MDKGAYLLVVDLNGPPGSPCSPGDDLELPGLSGAEFSIYETSRYLNEDTGSPKWLLQPTPSSGLIHGPSTYSQDK